MIKKQFSEWLRYNISPYNSSHWSMKACRDVHPVWAGKLEIVNRAIERVEVPERNESNQRSLDVNEKADVNEKRSWCDMNPANDGKAKRISWRCQPDLSPRLVLQPVHTESVCVHYCSQFRFQDVPIYVGLLLAAFLKSFSFVMKESNMFEHLYFSLQNMFLDQKFKWPQMTKYLHKPLVIL